MLLYPHQSHAPQIENIEYRYDPELDAANAPQINSIDAKARRDIFDAFRLEALAWSGDLEEPIFLGRIYDLESMPSRDSRFGNAEGDIWQHRVNNLDWDDDWLLRDPRFDLLRAPDETILTFLAESLHPAVRTEAQEVQRVKDVLNARLRNAGYELVERTRIAGRPVFAARRIVGGSTATLDSVRHQFAPDAAYVMAQINRMEAAIDSDPGLAVGTAKEVVETCCKTILHDRGVQVGRNWKLTRLVKETTRTLSLTPEDIDDQAKAVESIRALLGSLGTITHMMAELRNAYGTGHGKRADAKGLEPRHARLAAGAASTRPIFLLQTHEVR